LIFNFEWDPQKAKTNISKHKISFSEATSVFKDPMAISIFDEDHSKDEERWITLGISSVGNIIIVNHTFVKLDKNSIKIRIFSSRKAIKNERSQYEESN
jgi:uncharacterized protein